MKERTVSALKKGTVIDHIPAEFTFKVAEILKLDAVKNKIVIASNLESKKLGKKGILKIADMYLDKKCAQKIALIAPQASMSKIDDFKVIEKIKLERAKLLSGILKCYNPNCITNTEAMETKFIVVNEKPLAVKCGYCEREMNKEDIML